MKKFFADSNFVLTKLSVHTSKENVIHVPHRTDYKKVCDLLWNRKFHRHVVIAGKYDINTVFSSKMIKIRIFYYFYVSIMRKKINEKKLNYFKFNLMSRSSVSAQE